MNKQRQLEKLNILKENANLSLFDQMEGVNGKLKSIKDTLKGIDLKEVRTYEQELENLSDNILSLKESLEGKDMVVNIPLDKLSSSIERVETAIKNIKEVKIPEFPKFPSEIGLSEIQINELLFAIQSIPQFPIDSLKAMVSELGKKIEAIKLEVPESKEFDYDFLDKKFDKLIQSVKGISINVSGSGGGIGDRANDNLDTIATNTEGLATEDKQDDIISSIKGDWYDKQEIDLSYENNIVIAYKKNDTTILTETIVIDGDNITITKT